MPSEYIPTTKNVEDTYVWSCTDSYSGTTQRIARAEFNRWLDSVKTEAWDEGATAAAYSISATHHYANNPYKDSHD